MTKSGKLSPRRVIRPDRDAWRQDEAQEHATAPQDAAKARAVGEPPHFPTRRSMRGLDWFVFFVANVQTGFGPFVTVYLTAQKWTQVDIGLVSRSARWRRSSDKCPAAHSSTPHDPSGWWPA